MMVRHFATMMALAAVCAAAAAGPAWVKTDPQALPTRSMCAAIDVQLDQLAIVVKREMEGGSVDEAVRLAEKVFPLFPVHHVLHEQHTPTAVVDMDLPQELIDGIIHDLAKAKEVEREVYKIVNFTGTGYNQFGMEFDMAVLTQPKCLEFYARNRAIVKKHFPEATSCICNIFAATSKANVYGFHHASQLGIELGMLGQSNHYTEKHMSFHTALTPTNSSANPFTIFESEVPRVLNRDFLIRYFLEKRDQMPADKFEVAILSVAGFHPLIQYMKVDGPHRRSLQDLADAMYFWVERCMDGDTAGIGTHWDLKPGQGLYFNNWRVHSDNGFGSDEHPRYTADLRCFSPARVPWPFIDAYDLLLGVLPFVAVVHDSNANCVRKLFNFDLEKHFPRKRFSTHVGNVAMGFAGDLLEEEHAEVMKEYAKAVEHAYATDGVNYTAFSECFQTIKSITEDPMKNVRMSEHYTTAELFVIKVKLITYVVIVLFSEPTRAAVLSASLLVVFLGLRAVFGSKKGKAKNA